MPALSPVQVTELFAALLHGGSEAALGAVVAAGVMPRVFSLVLQYPFNNLLHNQARLILRFRDGYLGEFIDSRC